MKSPGEQRALFLRYPRARLPGRRIQSPTNQCRAAECSLEVGGNLSGRDRSGRTSVVLVGASGRPQSGKVSIGSFWARLRPCCVLPRFTQIDSSGGLKCLTWTEWTTEAVGNQKEPTLYGFSSPNRRFKPFSHDFSFYFKSSESRFQALSVLSPTIGDLSLNPS